MNRMSVDGMPAVIIEHDSARGTDSARFPGAIIEISDAGYRSLFDRFQALANTYGTNETVLITAASTARYGSVLRVLDVARAVHFEHFSFSYKLGTPNPENFAILLQQYTDRSRASNIPSIDRFNVVDIFVTAHDAVCLNDRAMPLETLQAGLKRYNSKQTAFSAADAATFSKVLAVANALHAARAPNVNLYFARVTHASNKQVPSPSRDCI